MGILGLLQFLKSCFKERRLSDYRGKTVAVDTYAWYLSPHQGYIKLSKDQVEDNSSSEEEINTDMLLTVSKESLKYKI